MKKTGDHQREIEAIDNQIDALVYQLYGLTEDEIAIVEGSIKPYEWTYELIDGFPPCQRCRCTLREVGEQRYRCRQCRMFYPISTPAQVEGLGGI